MFISMPKLFYQGHGSFRLTSDDEAVIFIDPFIGEGYDIPADLILITHQHPDHNQVDLITQKPGCEIISNVEAVFMKCSMSSFFGWLFGDCSRRYESAGFMRGCKYECNGRCYDNEVADGLILAMKESSDAYYWD